MADENDNTRWQLGDTVHIPLADDDTPQTPPLDDDMLPSIKYRYETHYLGNEVVSVMLESDLPWLIAEVDRLRAREAAAMGIVRDAVVDWIGFLSVSADCPWCDEFHENYAPTDPRPSRPHSADCYVTKARALLAEE